MTWDNFVQLGMGYLLPFMGLPLLGVVIGAWLTNSFFPFRLKRKEWHWEKELWAKELFLETVSRVSFISDHYLKGEYEEKFSMSGMSLNEADNETRRLVKELHSVGHKLKLYLNKSDAKLFEQYLRDSQTEYDAAKESWGEWYHDDYMAVTQHTENTIAEQGKVAANTLEKFKISS